MAARMCASQYGRPATRRAPQKWKSSCCGSPIGQRQSCMSSVCTVLRCLLTVFILLMAISLSLFFERNRSGGNVTVSPQPSVSRLNFCRAFLEAGLHRLAGRGLHGLDQMLGRTRRKVIELLGLRAGSGDHLLQVL